MSRIGKIPILIPPGVKVDVSDRRVTIQGPKGTLSWEVPECTRVTVSDGKIIVTRIGDDRREKAMHGLTRALLNNMVIGVTQGYSKRLEIQGVGFKASVQGNTLVLNLGYSHPVVYTIPPDIKITVEESTKILVEGIDKQKVGQVAAEIRAFYPPEPYKGKGIKYAGELIRRKEGKTAQ